MTFSVSHLGSPNWAALAFSATYCLISAPAIAQSIDRSLSPIVVTGSRFSSEAAFAPIGATVITSDQIRDAGVGNANEAIRKIGGVYGRASTTGSQDYDLDIRGFGATSNQNMVVLVDGIRLSESEQAVPLLSSIPIELIERIEIVRGGSSVLYGEGATGGAVHIITKRSSADKLKGTAFAEVGSFNHRELRASVVKGWDGFSLDANVGAMRSDNYRKNNDLGQENFSGGMQWALAQGRVGMRIDVARQDSRLAGPLTLTQFEANPRQTTTPDNYGSYDTDRYTLFAEKRVGDVELAADLSHRKKNAKGHLAYFGGLFDQNADSRTTQFSPRIRHLSESATRGNEFVLGMDFTKWDRETDSVDVSSFGTFSSQDKVSQDAKAIYVRDELRIEKIRIAAGARHERFEKEARGTNTYDKKNSLNAWEIQTGYALTGSADLFAKAGRSYRVANADENALTPTTSLPLKPQISRDLETGVALKGANQKLTVRLFRHRLKNEIAFDRTFGFFGANVNLDPTKREGIEIEGSVRLSSSFELMAILQHVNAEFSSGPNAGKKVPLVPQNLATVRINWFGGNGHRADLGLRWVDSQWYGNDIANSCNLRTPSFSTLDGRYAFRTGAWEFAVTGSNLTDRDSITYGFTNPVAGCRTSIYPDSGRLIKISARMDF